MTLVRLCAVILPMWAALATAASGITEYKDSRFHYAFRFPSTWKIQELPEGPANAMVRVLVRGPNQGSFVVIVEETEESIARDLLSDEARRKAFVERMVGETVERVYKRISQDIQAREMRIGDQTDLSDGKSLRYYISTLHSLKRGSPVIVAGIHAAPPEKKYLVNFIMTAVWNKSTQDDHEMMMQVFNSFHLLGD